MIKHLLKLVWNRKWVNLRIMIQILLSFLAVFAMIVWAVYYYDNNSHPLGFTYENVLVVLVTPDNDMAPEEILKKNNVFPKNLMKYHQLLAALREFDEIEAVGIIRQPPYFTWEWGGPGISLPWKGRTIHFGTNEATDGIKDVLGLKVINGRWFSREDDGATNIVPVVVNLKHARELFGAEDPVGKIIPDTPYRVVGVIEDFRVQGELGAPDGYSFLPFGPPRGGRYILIKVRPGTSTGFEEKILAKLKSEAKGWYFGVTRLTDMRENINRPRLIPMAIGGIIAGFLLIMVGLGLTGVLWLNVTRRTREIGLRRAEGATRRRIYRQILGEISIVATFGLLAGILIIVQLFPMLKFYSFVSTKVYIESIVISLGFVYSLAILCGLYPSRLAAKVNPAEALHYE